MSDKLQEFMQHELSHIAAPQISEESKHALFPLFGQLNEAHAAYTKATLTPSQKPNYSPTYAPPEIQPLIALCSRNKTVQTRIGRRIIQISVSSPNLTEAIADTYIYTTFLLTHLLVITTSNVKFSAKTIATAISPCLVLKLPETNANCNLVAMKSLYKVTSVASKI